MKKVFISQPMYGKTNEQIQSERMELISKLNNAGYEVIDSIIEDDVNPTVREIVKRRAKQNAKLSYYEIEEVVKREMKSAILNDTNVVKTSDIYKTLASNMRLKIRINIDDKV